ncbi:MAG: type II and III secretion system protein [Verrucomicrobia bacterium]|nr:type II and III secretion system protein [Verrucomicrobiota bacterium]
MRNILNLLTVVVLMGGVAVAQQSPEDIEKIMEQLMSTSSEPATPAEPEPVAEPEPAVVAEPAPAPVETAPVDVEALLEQSREQFLGGEFVKAQRGFEESLRLQPENKKALMYLRALRDRDYRKTATEQIDGIDAAWSTRLLLRSYALGQDGIEKMELGEVEDAKEVRELFPQVEFPQGAKATYQPDMEILFVRNTLKNLTRLEAILDATGVLKDSGETDQVEIEARFVEVAEGALEELGFQWNFEDPQEVTVLGKDLDVRDGPRGLFADSLRGSPTGADPALPFSRPAELGDEQLPSSGNWSSFRFEDTFNKYPDSVLLTKQSDDVPFDLLISALNQNTGTDVLSAPRVVTKSGEEAIIRVGERHYFPEMFKGNAEQATMLNISYEDFEETLLGVELSVTPEVDGDQIELDLHPRITELAGWQQHQLAPADSIYNHRQSEVGQRYLHEPVVAKLPIFKIREVETSMRIADGSTIGMGGLINEKIEAYTDRVPVVSHIPLIGRFFRNEGERVVKRNLLIFVTAKKVDPNGRIYSSRSFE